MVEHMLSMHEALVSLPVLQDKKFSGLALLSFSMLYSKWVTPQVLFIVGLLEHLNWGVSFRPQPNHDEK